MLRGSTSPFFKGGLRGIFFFQPLADHAANAFCHRLRLLEYLEIIKT